MKTIKLSWTWPYGGPQIERSEARVRIVAMPGDGTKYDVWCFRIHTYDSWLVSVLNFGKLPPTFTWAPPSAPADIVDAFRKCPGTPSYNATALIAILRAYLEPTPVPAAELAREQTELGHAESEDPS